MGSREHVIEIGGGFWGILVHLEGGGRQRGRYGSEHRYGRRNISVRQDDLYCGCLCYRWRVATQKYSEQHNEPFVDHQISLLLILALHHRSEGTAFLGLQILLGIA